MHIYTYFNALLEAHMCAQTNSLHIFCFANVFIYFSYFLRASHLLIVQLFWILKAVDATSDKAAMAELLNGVMVLVYNALTISV